MDLVINYHNFYEKRIMDLGLLKYVFRSIEHNANVFNKTYFIYDGNDTMLPDWLNTSMVTLIKHDDFIPSAFLPTFNEHTIEVFMHQIPGLSDDFVYIKENTFFLKPLTSNDFFNAGKSIISYSDKPEYEEYFLIEKFHSDVTEWISIEKQDDTFKDYVIIPEKGAYPLFKRINQMVYNKLSEFIKVAHGVFEDESNNITSDVFLCAEIREHATEKKLKRDFLLLDYYKTDLQEKLESLNCDILSVNPYRINNTKEFENASNIMTTYLNRQFNKKSKFEK